MRTSTLFFVLGTTILSITGCKKDTVNLSNPVPFKIEREYVPPIAYAGGEAIVILPADSCMLRGSGSHDAYTTISYIWRKISGPSSVKISNPDASGTRVNDLIKGVYEFELTVTDKRGSTDTDTISVKVGEISTKEIHINNIRWRSEGLNGLTWGSDLYVKDIYSLIPVGSVFKVFINSEVSGGWVEAIGAWTSELINAQYTLTIYDSNISISTALLEGATADIKIVY